MVSDTSFAHHTTHPCRKCSTNIQRSIAKDQRWSGNLTGPLPVPVQDRTTHLDWTPSTGVVVRSQAPPPPGCATPSPCYPKSQPTQRKYVIMWFKTNNARKSHMTNGQESGLSQWDRRCTLETSMVTPLYDSWELYQPIDQCMVEMTDGGKQQQRLQPHPLLGKAQGSGVYPGQELSARKAWKSSIL